VIATIAVAAIVLLIVFIGVPCVVVWSLDRKE
jgi:hypothetical protein